ncbi:lytic transglycosylase domain-containing protein [Myxococcota bacterium]|nr:lytic transglycosylase domain-containing protein [Myxococcota bacterium]
MRTSPLSALAPMLFLALAFQDGTVLAEAPTELLSKGVESVSPEPASPFPADAGSDPMAPEARAREIFRSSRMSRGASLEAFLARQPTGLSADDRRRLAGAILDESKRHGFDPSLVLAVIHVESRFQTKVVSSAGAVGLMQLRPATARAMAESLGVAWTGPELLLDPVLNVRLGTAYVKRLRDRFDSLDVALVAYNWGPTRIGRKIRRGEALPTNYVSSVMTTYETIWRPESENS